MKKLLAVALLFAALSVTSSAGIMETPPGPVPDPSPTPETTTQTEESDLSAEIALWLIQNLPLLP